MVYRFYSRLRLILEVSRTLGMNTAAKQRLFWGGLWLFFNDNYKTNHGFTATINKFCKNFNFYFEDFSDYFTLHEIFIEEEYALDLSEEPAQILDLGSNIGLSLLYFHLKYPQAKLYGFELDPENYRRLVCNVQPFEEIHVQQAAITHTDGTTEAFIDPHRGQSSSLNRHELRQDSIWVQAQSLDTILDQLEFEKVDLLKFDIEGAEMEVFSDFARHRVIGTYIGEVHEDLARCNVKDFTALFSETHNVEITKLNTHRYQMVARRKKQSCM